MNFYHDAKLSGLPSEKKLESIREDRIEFSGKFIGYSVESSPTVTLFTHFGRVENRIEVKASESVSVATKARGAIDLKFFLKLFEVLDKVLFTLPLSIQSEMIDLCDQIHYYSKRRSKSDPRSTSPEGYQFF